MKFTILFILLLHGHLLLGQTFTDSIQEDDVIQLLEIADIHFEQWEDADAVSCIEEALFQAKVIGMSEQKTIFGRGYRILGYYYQTLEDYAKALQAYQKSIEILEKTAPSLISTTYFNMAHLYSYQARYQKALKYYRKSLNHHLSQTPIDSNFIARHYIHIGDMYRSIFATQKDFVRIDTALHFYDKSLRYTLDDGSVSWKKARLYLDKGNQAFAEHYIKRAEQLMGKDAVLALKRQIQSISQKHQVALTNLQKELEQEKSNREKAKIHLSIGEVYKNLGIIDSSLQHIQKALQLLIPSFKQNDPIVNPNLAAIAEKDTWIVQALINKGNAFKKRAKGEDLEYALNCYHLVFDAVELLMQDSEDKSEQVLRGYVHIVVENMLEIYTERKDTNSLYQAFEAIEKNKAITLLKKITDTQKVQVRSIREVQNQLLSDTSVNKALLQYFVGNNTIYAFLITQNDIQLQSIPNTKTLKQQIDNFQISLTNNLLPNYQIRDSSMIDRQKFNDYTNLALELYGQLLGEHFDTTFLNEIQQLYIIPDDYIYTIPFEALLTQIPDNKQIEEIRYRTLNYLLKKHTISYAYSATLLLESLQERTYKPKYRGTLLGFAPSFKGKQGSMRGFDGEELLDLKNGEKEVEEISRIVDGRIYLREAAGKEAFLDEARHYRILHLSTHAYADEANYEDNLIYFANSYLVNKELSTLRLQADLAVLSACLSGRGFIQRGEGVMSLARAFLYAGCPSVVSSLWSVDDKKTSELMENFYTNLKAGESKSAALQNAKRSFLKNHNNEEAHPFYWAAFVQIGNPSPMDLPNSNNWEFWGMLIFVLGLTIILLFTIGNRSKRKGIEK